MLALWIWILHLEILPTLSFEVLSLDQKEKVGILSRFLMKTTSLFLMTIVGVKSRTGYVIQVADCPIVWKSQLQANRTATSTLEAEITALAACCRELFPIMDMVESIRKVYKLKVPRTTMNVSIHEDNAGAQCWLKRFHRTLLRGVNGIMRKLFGFVSKLPSVELSWSNVLRLINLGISSLRACLEPHLSIFERNFVVGR